MGDNLNIPDNEPLDPYKLNYEAALDKRIAKIEKEFNLGHTKPNKGNNMNEIIDNVAAVTDGVEVKHFALALDKDGKEVRVEIKPTGEFSQDVDDKPEPVPTIH